MTDLTIGGETFNVLLEGDPALPVVMLSNALGATLRLWDAQMPDLLARFRVLRYDGRGHGGSVSNAGPYSIAGLGLDALAILDALDIDTVHWIGISKGGAVGQWLLINAPDRIERAVLANTAAQFGAAQSWNARITTARRQGLAALADATIARWFGDAFRQIDSDAVEAVKTAFVATAPEGYASASAALRDMDLREGLRGVDHPVLVIAGRDDASITAEQTDHLVAAIANARLVTLDARHISNVEAAAAFNKAVMDFLTAKTVRRPVPRKVAAPLPTARRAAGRRTAATRGAMTDATIRRPSAPAAKLERGERSAAKTTPPKTAPATAARPKASSGKISSGKISPGKISPGKTSPGKATAKSTPKLRVAMKAKAGSSKAAPPKAAPPKAAPPKAAPPKTKSSKKQPARSAATKPATAVRPTSSRAKTMLAKPLKTARLPAKARGSRTVKQAVTKATVSIPSAKVTKKKAATKTVRAKATVAPAAAKTRVTTKPKASTAPAVRPAKGRVPAPSKVASKPAAKPVSRRK